MENAIISILALFLGYFIGKQPDQPRVIQIKDIFPKKVKVFIKQQPKTNQEQILNSIKEDKKIIKQFRK